MKKLLFGATMAVIISMGFSSCKKTEAALTMLGTWQVDSYKENGTDQTTVFLTAYENYQIMFDASNNYIETYTLLGVHVTNAGPWKLTNGGEDFELTNQGDGTKRYFHIIELNPESASISEDSGAKEYHMLKD
ncbi:MAG: lipocalin family protein [Flavobacteriales bacterium]|nr:lipocalin family protein [Flavobacteriales bacterium]